jgi:hypothetical protein
MENNNQDAQDMFLNASYDSAQIDNKELKQERVSIPDSINSSTNNEQVSIPDSVNNSATSDIEDQDNVPALILIGAGHATENNSADTSLSNQAPDSENK